MAAFIAKCFFGTAHPHGHRLKTSRVSRAAIWLLALLLLTAIQCLLPFSNGGSGFAVGDSQHVYNAVTLAIVNNQNWGKQALAGVLEYPPLPSFCFLIAYPLDLLHTHGWPLPPAYQLITAGAQMLILMLVIQVCWKAFGKGMGSAIGVIFFSVLWLLSSTAGVHETALRFWQINPYWVCGVPVAALFKHVFTWDLEGNDRNRIWASILCGVLVFCGIVGIITALCILPLLLQEHGRNERKGGAWLVCLPFLYAVAMHFLFNQLVMGNWLFAWQRFMDYFIANQQDSTMSAFAYGLAATSTALCLTGFVLQRLSLTARLGWHLILAFALLHLLQTSGQVFLGGATLLGALACLPVLFQAAAVPKQDHRRLHAVAACVGVILLIGVIHLRRSAVELQHFRDSKAPSRSEIISYVDRHWQDSRILLYGLRAAALYAPAAEATEEEQNRFLVRLDFNRHVLMEEIESEQFHLLIPPDNGRYYPLNHPIFSYVHQNGVPEWLLLERIWPAKAEPKDAWQLWRCIRARPQPEK